RRRQGHARARQPAPHLRQGCVVALSRRNSALAVGGAHARRSSAVVGRDRRGDFMNWREIWESRSLGGGTPLQQLMAADGFDGFAQMDERAWRDYVARVGERLGIAPRSSIFEVGCGAGAFLFPWHEAEHPIGGIDASSRLLGFARQAMPGARLEQRQ